MTLVIAHRGASGHAPENTMPAYELAVTQRSDMIEVDLHRTRDGAVVLTHDELLEGLGGHGEIADASLAEVRALDAGEGESVPTLHEVMERFASRIPFNLELKASTRGPYPGLEALAVEAAVSRGVLAQTLFSSFYDAVLRELRAVSTDARLGVLVSGRHPEGWLDRARDVGACAVNFWAGLASDENVKRAHAEGLRVNVYTVDDLPQMRTLVDRGVDGIFTNYPDRLRALLG